MENDNEACGGTKTNDENPSSVVEAEAKVEADAGTDVNLSAAPQASRTPFTSLSQVDADRALARTLQEQERAYMMLRMNGDVSDYGSSDAGSYADEDEDGDDDEDEDEDEVDDPNEDENAGTDAEEDASDVHDHADAADDDQGNEFDSDEAFARALQEAEEREMAVHLMALAGINDWEAEDTEDHGSDSQDTWEEVDPDELSYEELLALGEAVGTESRGLPVETIASLPSINYKAQSSQDGSADQCVICRLDFEDGDALTVLSCKHSYHPGCINNWLQINKVCPVCSTEVSVSGSK